MEISVSGVDYTNSMLLKSVFRKSGLFMLFHQQVYAVEEACFLQR